MFDIKNFIGRFVLFILFIFIIMYSFFNNKIMFWINIIFIVLIIAPFLIIGFSEKSAGGMPSTNFLAAFFFTAIALYIFIFLLFIQIILIMYNYVVQGETSSLNANRSKSNRPKNNMQ